jgi:hypothetical protein
MLCWLRSLLITGVGLVAARWPALIGRKHASPRAGWVKDNKVHSPWCPHPRSNHDDYFVLRDKNKGIIENLLKAGSQRRVFEHPNGVLYLSISSSRSVDEAS